MLLQWMMNNLTMSLMLILMMVKISIKCPPGWMKTKVAKAAATAATKQTCKLLVTTPVSNDYSKLVALSAAIAASNHYKSRMDV
jgi:hypothetical protein